MNQLLLAPPKPQPRLAPPKPHYYVWAMNERGHSYRVSLRVPTLVGAERVAACHSHFPFAADFVYIVGWRGNVCVGHWHNITGPWVAGDMREQVRAFIKPAKRKRTPPRGRW